MLPEPEILHTASLSQENLAEVYGVDLADAKVDWDMPFRKPSDLNVCRVGQMREVGYDTLTIVKANIISLPILHTWLEYGKAMVVNSIVPEEPYQMGLFQMAQQWYGGKEAAIATAMMALKEKGANYFVARLGNEQFDDDFRYRLEAYKAQLKADGDGDDDDIVVVDSSF